MILIINESNMQTHEVTLATKKYYINNFFFANPWRKPISSPIKQQYILTSYYYQKKLIILKEFHENKFPVIYI